MIVNRIAAAKEGAKFEARYKGEVYHLTVTKAEAGNIMGVKLKEIAGEFKSLSTAGKAIMGIACNGWRFFTPAGELPAPRDATKAKVAKATSKKGKKVKGKPATKKAAKPKRAAKAKAPKTAVDAAA